MDMLARIVDAHHHLWKISAVDYPWLRARGERRFFGDPTPIQRDYLPADFREDWTGLDVVASVHIQVGVAKGAEVDETRWLAKQTSATGLPTAIVAAADLADAGIDRLLDYQQAASAGLRGIRQIVSRRDDEDRRTGSPALLQDSRFLSGLKQLASRGLSFDLQLTPPYLLRATELLSQVPELRVALCHLGSPWDQSPDGLSEWRRGLRAYAGLPHSYCKLSGFGMFDPAWTLPSLEPLIEGVLTAFPPERVMWGSNFPVDKLYRGYRETAEAVASFLTSEQREQIFWQTAQAHYRL